MTRAPSLGARAVLMQHLPWWLAIVWIVVVPAVELVWRQATPDVPRVLRGWHMFRDVGADACVFGLSDAAGRRVSGGDLSDSAKNAFDRIVIAGGPIDDDSADVKILCENEPPLSPAYFCRSTNSTDVDDGALVGDAFRCPP